MRTKTCPFCDSQRNEVNYDGNGAYVACDDCGAQGPASFVDVDESCDDLERDAIESWNMRPSQMTGIISTTEDE